MSSFIKGGAKEISDEDLDKLMEEYKEMFIVESKEEKQEVLMNLVSENKITQFEAVNMAIRLGIEQ